MTAENPALNEKYWLCPLYSFECYAESVDLAEDIKIKRIPPEFATYLFEESDSSFFRTFPNDVEWMSSLPYCAEGIEGAVEENIRIGLEEERRASNLLVDLIFALKLLHEGRIIAGPLISAVTHNSEWSIGGETIWTSVSEGHFFLEESKYEFCQQDITEVNDLLENIREWRASGFLNIVEIALKRFHSAYHGDIEDRMIDQMIAFESLFIGESQELTYKLALRTAFLLGRTKPKRDEIFKYMKKAYNYRSRIVHGDNPPTREELRVIVPNTGDYLRQSIQKFLFLLSRGISLNEIRNKLDENILSNGTLLG